MEDKVAIAELKKDIQSQGKILEGHVLDYQENHKKLAETLEGQNEKLNAILIQATKTNGRVLSLEGSRIEVAKILEEQKVSISSLNNYKWWLSGVVALVMTVGGFMYTTTTTNLKYELKNSIAQSVEDMLDKRVDQVLKAQ